MNRTRDIDKLISEFLDDGLTELPDRAYDAVRSHIDHTRQRVVLGPWKEEQVSRFAKFALAAAAVVLIAVVGIRFLPNLGGVGVQPTPTPSPAPTASAAVPIHIGVLDAGTYVATPFGPVGPSFAVTVPSASWDGLDFPGPAGTVVGLAWSGNSNGVGMGFIRVDSLNPDPCKWHGTADDVDTGSSVDELVSALESQTAYDVSDASDVSVDGYTGKNLQLTMPATGFSGSTALGCDEAMFQVWNGEGFTINAQGPSNRWDVNILDVDGERVVTMASDFADSEPLRQTELRAIVDSIQINP